MSNFYELQQEKPMWTLATDERLFEKLKYMQENVISSAQTIHESVTDLQRAINAAHTTLHNSINAFNALNFNKFVENVLSYHPHSLGRGGTSRPPEHSAGRRDGHRHGFHAR